MKVDDLLAFTQGSPEYGGQALLAFRALGAGVLGITGLIVGGALSMKYVRGDRPGLVQAARGGDQCGRNVPHGRR